MRPPQAARLLFLLGVLACEANLTTTGPRSEAPTVGLDAPVGTSDLTSASLTCPNCTFEPEVYTRATGTPVTHIIEFEGNPAGAYVLETDDFRGQGAESRLWLNGTRMKVGVGMERQDVVLDWQNTLEVRLTGKPGSKLQVRIYQEVASVEVTPGTARARIPANTQFTAVARDRNGVTIPRQTFTWTSEDVNIATVGATTGRATTTGPVHDVRAFTHHTLRTGEGQVQIRAHADGTPDKFGTGALTVVSGFVYVTLRAPLPVNSSRRSERPTAQAFRYDEVRLSQMAATCARESANLEWHVNELPGVPGDRLFRQCYPILEHTTLTRVWTPPTPLTPGFYTFGVAPNVGLYGRYCGGGQPAGDWWTLANGSNYQPADAADALCMDHDRSELIHELHATNDAAQAACIVRWGIENEALYEEGNRVLPSSARWILFWNRWPAMAEARQHWLDTASLTCFGPIYNTFLSDRGL